MSMMVARAFVFVQRTWQASWCMLRSGRKWLWGSQIGFTTAVWTAACIIGLSLRKEQLGHLLKSSASYLHVHTREHFHTYSPTYCASVFILLLLWWIRAWAIIKGPLSFYFRWPRCFIGPGFSPFVSLGTGYSLNHVHCEYSIGYHD